MLRRMALRIGHGQMSDPIHFAKLSGSGNDFVCIDNRDGRHDALLGSAERAARFAQVVCRRRLGVGADGVVFATPCASPEQADLGARHFEPDGSEAELCGNGTACFTRWVLHNGWMSKEELKILTPGGVVLGRNSEGRYVRVCISLPRDMRMGLALEAGGTTLNCDFVITGVPHVVTYVDDVNAVDVASLGRAVRHHEKFKPRGANANFVQVIREGELAMRTFEFGVEGETLACGTGSAAAAILAAARFGWHAEYTTAKRPVLVRARSGDVLRVYVARQEDGVVSDLCLETVVRFIYGGTLNAEFAGQAMGGK